jgi:hypothetical protein
MVTWSVALPSIEMGVAGSVTSWMFALPLNVAVPLRVRRRHPRRREDDAEVVAADRWKARRFLPTPGFTDLRNGPCDIRQGRRDLDNFARSANGEYDVDARNVAGFQAHAVGHVNLEAGAPDLQANRPGGSAGTA